jgi:eukaryotic-like serine/threonine-protein kinase
VVDPTPLPQRTALRLPVTFGNYLLFDHIGRGGMADIYVARVSTELGGVRRVVIKLIVPELAQNQKFSDMLTQEAKLAAKLNHANVVQVIDLGRFSSDLYIAMEYVEGLDLNDLLRRCSRKKIALPIPYGLLIVMETLRGLDYAHRCIDEHGQPIGIVHRDVSPSNVLVSFEGEVKVCDFGIAHANIVASSQFEETIQGKAGYMSPEHARGDALDARADVFAVGTLLWELLAGRRRYRAKQGHELLAQAREAAFEFPPSRDLPNEAELHAILQKALAPQPEQRYASAQAMLNDLEEYVGMSRLLASPLKLGTWLTDTFSQEILEFRRDRERASQAMLLGPPVVLEAIGHVSEEALSRAVPKNREQTPSPEVQAETPIQGADVLLAATEQEPSSLMGISISPAAPVTKKPVSLQPQASKQEQRPWLIWALVGILILAGLVTLTLRLRAP